MRILSDRLILSAATFLGVAIGVPGRPRAGCTEPHCIRPVGTPRVVVPANGTTNVPRNAGALVFVPCKALAYRFEWTGPEGSVPPDVVELGAGVKRQWDPGEGFGNAVPLTHW